MKSINVNIVKNIISYKIQLGSNILSNTYDLIDKDLYKSYVLIYDTNIDESKINDINKSIKARKIIYNIPIALKELGKSFNGYRFIVSQLLKYNCDRGTALIAVGGGTLGDLVGFVSSTFYRGISYIQIPTTLLSMIDSSIGGKTAIDMEEGKNLIGSYHHPDQILIDVNMINDIPRIEINSALFEAIKYGLILDSSLFDFISENFSNLLNGDMIYQLVEHCCKLKVNVVQNDEMDNNERKKLNFGHTIGHSIENIYNIRHGEAVGYGMILSCYISMRLGSLPEIDYNKLLSLIKKLSLPQIKLDSDLILEQMKKDKKRINGKYHFILLNEIGNSYITDEVTDDLIKEAIDTL